MAGLHIMGTQAGRFLLFQNPAWDFHTFNFDSDPRLLREEIGDSISADDPDLKAFKKRGGKLILYHGWSDSMLSPLGTVNYYNSLVSEFGEKGTDQFLRLHMVPGMQHCIGGHGPDSFGQFGVAQGDAQNNVGSALEQWVEKNIAPDKIIAVKYKTDGDKNKNGVDIFCSDRIA